MAVRRRRKSLDISTGPVTEIMRPYIRFRAALLFDSGLVPGQDIIDHLHDAPGSAAHVARIQRFTRWFRDQIAGSGIAVKDMTFDEDGWSVYVYGSQPVGFAVCMISAADNSDPLFSILVVEIDDDAEDFMRETGKTIETILRQSVEISDVKIEPA